ncbi:Protein ABIL1 [Mucuna pruriens]|uniref:Protein ABIL1 n=1 Tax=Mucuna pruriens TaxID=157652 RepID=A0A371G0N9_MUCPR|nr:Protein ABIL1 [Mucuna pruriens]
MEHRAMTFDEVSMERSKSFIFALQELKNLRPQLYSAAEYCEKSYLHSDKKQMVLDNMKDYAVRALVNAVDHLGTVAYKLSDLLEQQTFDVSTMDLKVSTLNQKLLTCHMYTDKEGLRQQQLLAFIPRHHKHYILPSLLTVLIVSVHQCKLDSANKKVHFSSHKQIDARQNPLQTRTRLPSSGTPISKTLSWHLASETKSTLKKQTSRTSKNAKDSKFSAKTSGVFHLLDSEERTWMKPSVAQLHLTNGVPTSSAATQTLGVTGRDALKGSKPLTTFGSFDDRNGCEVVQGHTRSKSVLASFFIKQKAAKLKGGQGLDY